MPPQNAGPMLLPNYLNVFDLGTCADEVIIAARMSCQRCESAAQSKDELQ